MIIPTAARSSARPPMGLVSRTRKATIAACAFRPRASERRGTAAATRRSADRRAKALRQPSTWALRRPPCRAKGTRSKKSSDVSACSNVRPNRTRSSSDIADYVSQYEIGSAEAYNTARLCLMDTLGCAWRRSSIRVHQAAGPVVPGTSIQNGARVPGTHSSSIRWQAPSTSGR